MKRRFIIGLVAILMTALLAAPSMAKSTKIKAGEKGQSKQAGKSNIGHLYLYEKVPGEDRLEPWTIVKGGMWGKMKYRLSGPTFNFVFNGHKLPIGQSYTLIYYPDPWPAAGLICLGSGIVTECEKDGIGSGGGDLHIKGSVNTGSLPISSDDNYLRGAKIFLVPSDDVDCENKVMIGWTENENLYEGALIFFKDTNE